MNRRQLLASAGALAAAPFVPLAAEARRFGGVGGGVTAPPSINAPVSGSDLTAVWNLQTSGAGPTGGYTNGAWVPGSHTQGNPVAGYLGDISRNGLYGTNGGGDYVFFYIGSLTTITIDNFDFSLATGVFVGDGNCTVTFNNCKFPAAPGAGLCGPSDINGNPQSSGSSLIVICNNCLFDKSVFSLPSGSMAFNYCRFTNQAQNLGDTPFSGAGVCHLSFDHCYITGGGTTAVQPAHVELSQVNAPTGSTFSLSNTFVDISKDGQTTRTGSVAFWTGVWSIPSVTAVTLSNCILIGLAAVNANAGAPNVVSCAMAYNDTTPMTITNTVIESGVNGYTVNQQAGAHRPTDGGGNRSFGNLAITAADLG